MSKKGYISRYLLLLKKLQRKPYTGFAELQQYIESQLEYLQLQDERLNMGFSKRTLQRDIREINLLFGVQIEYSKRDKGYYIVESPAENHSFQRMLESFDLFHSLNLAQDIAPYILPENRPAQGQKTCLDCSMSSNSVYTSDSAIRNSGKTNRPHAWPSPMH